MGYTRRGFLGGARQTTLVGDISDSATTIPGADFSTWAGITSNGPGTATINQGESDEETITFTGISGSNLTTVTRGAAGTTAQAHTSGAKIDHTSSVTDFDEANAHIADTTLDHHTQYAKTDGSRSFTGVVTIAPSTTGSVGLLVNTPAGQTADLVNLDVNSVAKYRVNASGGVVSTGPDSYFGSYANGLGTGVSRAHLTSDASGIVIASEGDGADRGIRFQLKGVGNFKFQDATPTVVAQIDSVGVLSAAGTSSRFGPYALNNGTNVSSLRIQGTTGAMLIVAEGDGANRDIGYRTKGTGSHFLQSENGQTLMGVVPDAATATNTTITLPLITTATTASAGAQTLPANPVGFLPITINGTVRKIPYYAS